MLLVGFAERVVTAPSFMGCSENCLKSLQLFSMNCTSAIFFYEVGRSYFLREFQNTDAVILCIHNISSFVQFPFVRKMQVYYV